MTARVTNEYKIQNSRKSFRKRILLKFIYKLSNINPRFQYFVVIFDN